MNTVKVTPTKEKIQAAIKLNNKICKVIDDFDINRFKTKKKRLFGLWETEIVDHKALEKYYNKPFIFAFDWGFNDYGIYTKAYYNNLEDLISLMEINTAISMDADMVRIYNNLEKYLENYKHD